MMATPSGWRSSDPGAAGQRQRDGAENRGQRRHQDRPEALAAGLEDRHLAADALLALMLQREVHHHDGILLDDAHQQDDADQRDDGEGRPGDQQRQQRADPGGRQRRQDGDRVQQVLVQHAEDDVDGQQRRQDQQRHVAGEGLEGAGVACELGPHAIGQADLVSRLLHQRGGVAQRHAGRQVEGDGRRRVLALVGDRQRRRGRARA